MQAGYIPSGHQEVNGGTHRPPNLEGSREQVVREIDVGVFEALDEEAALGMGLKVQKLDYRLCRRHSKHPEEQGDATLRNGLKTSVVS